MLPAQPWIWGASNVDAVEFGIALSSTKSLDHEEFLPHHTTSWLSTPGRTAELLALPSPRPPHLTDARAGQMSSERLLEIAIDYRQELRVWATATDLGLDTLAYC